MTWEIIEGDCLEEMARLPDASVDAIITDPPYGTTACKWDSVIPFAPMWEQVKRIAKPRAAIVLFGSQPFTSALVMSNPGMFKYAWVWHKSRPTDFINAKNKPMKAHEDVVVFSDGTTANRSEKRMPYFPQGLRPDGSRQYRPGSKFRADGAVGQRPCHVHEYVQEFKDYPTSVLSFPSMVYTDHPTQKPVTLMEYLIRTYTNEGDTVLDFCAGSGSTGVACMNTGRNFIGIERDHGYCAIARRRLTEAAATQQPALFAAD